MKETPGTVSVIDDAAIARRMMENTADLVTYEPGVYVESNLTRIGSTASTSAASAATG